MKTPSSLWFVVLLLSSCVDNLSFRKFDNPEIRRLQKLETDRHIGMGDERSAMQKQVAVRTRYIHSYPPGLQASFDRTAGGRGAVVTADGYVITAYHVVKDRDFEIEEILETGRPLEKVIQADEIDLYFKTYTYPGRLVWHDPKTDLAVVKFEVSGWPHFTHFNLAPPPNARVFAADDEGRGSIPTVGTAPTTMKDRQGNGPFFSAGIVKKSTRSGRNPDVAETATTLVARGGMSGAALVTSENELCGVILSFSGVWPLRLPGGSGPSGTTEAAMLEPKLLWEIIQADRQASGP